MNTNYSFKALGVTALIVVSLLSASCALPPQEIVETATAWPSSTQALKPTASLVPPLTPTSPTPSALPVIQLPGQDAVVLTIENPQPFSGKEGEPRPDWLGWGAEAFAVAADGSFWLADTAVSPNRLLHYSPQGVLLQQISLSGILVYAQSLVVARESLWVLDIFSQQPKVVQLDYAGNVLASLDWDTSGERFYEGLLTCDQTNLLVFGPDGYTELVDGSGDITQKPLQELSCNGHRYQIRAGQGSPLVIDGVSNEMPLDFRADAMPFLGFNPDGSFAISGYGVDDRGQPDWQQAQVRVYAPSGQLLGIACQRPMNIYKAWNHQLAFGPQGSVYQLLSNPDHAVQIVRLGFGDRLPPLVVVPTVTPVLLSALQPAASATTAEEQARQALVSFFSNLSAGNYPQAATYFSGDPGETLPTQALGKTLVDYWSNICAQFRCLAVAEITGVHPDSESQYTFDTVFVNPDGTRFELGACCGGDPAAFPPVWQFAFPVQKLDGVWKVMRGPVYVP